MFCLFWNCVLWYLFLLIIFDLDSRIDPIAMKGAVFMLLCERLNGVMSRKHFWDRKSKGGML